MKEIWQTIEGYSNYKISTKGRIYSNLTHRILKPRIYNGYIRANLINDEGEHKHPFVHKLVAETFLLNIYNQDKVNHINGDTCDNRLENLSWCSNNSKGLYQAMYVKKTFVPYKIPKEKHYKRLIIQKKGNRTINKFYGGVEAESKTGISKYAIYYGLYNNKKVNGFKFIWGKDERENSNR